MKTSTLLLALIAAVSGAAGSQTFAADRPATPKSVDGHPDLTGTWDTGGGIPQLKAVKTDHGICVGCVAGQSPTAATGLPPPKPNADLPVYKPEFVAKVQNLKDHQTKYDTSLHCRNPGVPRLGPPQKIVQTKGQVVLLYADLTGAEFRIVPTDGRAHRTDVSDSYMGDSVGHWEGDTLVVDVVNFNDDSWLGDDGLFHTTDLHVVEKLRRTGNTLHYQATVYDPKVLAQPWVMQPRTMQLTDNELVETPPCVEQDFANMTDETYHHNNR